jgi:hypothetical protein
MAAIEHGLHERTDNASLSCRAMPRSLVDKRSKIQKSGHFVSLFPMRTMPFSAAIVLHISFRRNDVRYGRALFGEPKSLVAARAAEKPGNFGRCSVHPTKPFLRHPACPPWSSNNSPRCSMSEEEIPLSQHDQLAMAIAQGKSIAGSFHGIHGTDVRSMVAISPEHLTSERTGVMAYQVGSAQVSSDRSRMSAGVRFCGSHRRSVPQSLKLSDRRNEPQKPAQAVQQVLGKELLPGLRDPLILGTRSGLVMSQDRDTRAFSSPRPGMAVATNGSDEPMEPGRWCDFPTARATRPDASRDDRPVLNVALTDRQHGVKDGRTAVVRVFSAPTIA